MSSYDWLVYRRKPSSGVDTRAISAKFEIVARIHLDTICRSGLQYATCEITECERVRLTKVELGIEADDAIALRD